MNSPGRYKPKRLQLGTNFEVKYKYIGTVGTAVASDTRGPRFESRRREY